MAGNFEIRSKRGRLYYTPRRQSSATNSPPGFFQPRVPRPHTLHISRVSAADLDLGRTAAKNTERSFDLKRKLANPRESVKRFVRYVASQKVASSSALSSEPTNFKSSQASNRSSQTLAEGMVFADAGRNGYASNNSIGGSVSGLLHRRPSIGEDVRAASAMSNRSTGSNSSANAVQMEEKPIASANGLSISISLAEPVLFLQGFDNADPATRTTTMLRGSLHLKVAKSAKIKAVTLSFKGKAETDWPEGIPPKKVEIKDTESIMNHTWTFFNAQFQMAEPGHGADHVQPLKVPCATTKELGVPGVVSSSFDPFQRGHKHSHSESLSAKEAKSLSLQVNQSRSFGKGESPTGGPTTAQKGYRTFTPGEYVYNFELPIDSHLPESIDVELGRVKYGLSALIERSGAFRANLMGSKEVTLIRTPSEGSLETVEPIAISRNWEDQLHYDIVISGKSFPLGAQVPIAFKLIPLAKVQCHRIKVFLTENVQYYTSNKRVHRLEPTRKLQLFEKRADGPSTSTFPGSSVRITAGGGVSYDSREAAAQGDESVARDTTNLLGNLEGEHNVGPTEMEFNVQLPSCHTMKERERGIHFDTTFQGIQVHHWIKIVMRLSKPDAVDPTKRRHFEISIDSPFHILSCRATQANTALPAYTSPESATLLTDHYECGCPDAPKRRNSPATLPTLSTLQTPNNSSLFDSSRNQDTPGPPSAGLTRPPAALVHDPNSGPPRPMHLLRVPSFNPPAFEADDPPPPLMTPPPQYDSVVGRSSHDAWADYFARMADEEDDDSTQRSRMEVPLTPGGRINRSMDERRTWLPLGHAAAQ